MRNRWKRFMAAVLALVLCLNVSAAAEASSAQGGQNTQDAEISGEGNALSIEGNGSLGALFTEPLEEEIQKQEENEGCNIFSIEVDGTAALAQFETTENAELVVVVYDESGTEMIASGSTQVYAGDESAVVEIETETMPQYFYLRGFLIEQNSLHPVCSAYESPNYTKDMQDFLVSTTDDYEAGRVLNFDEAKDTNFAVYADGTVILHMDDPGTNRITVLDEAKQSYRIENADAAALALAAGDVFSCTLTDGTVLVVKVGEVTVEGTTVTVTGQDGLTMEEVFSYVKIEEDLGMETAKVDPSTCDAGVTYNGLVDEEKGNARTADVTPYAGGSETVTKAMDYTLVDKKIGSGNATASLNGSIKLSFDNTFEYYLTLSNTYLSLRMDYNGTLAIHMSGHASGSVTVSNLTFSALGVVNFVLTPEILFEANAKLDITGKLYGTVGFSCSVQEGMKNLTTAPKLEASLEAEADLYVGLKLRPSVNIVSDKIAEVSMTATVGGQVKGKLAMTNIPASGIQHECTACVDGDVFAKYSLSFQAKLLNQDWLTYNYQVTDQTVKVMDFYYSISRNEFAFTSCPHILYLVTVTVKDTAGLPISGAAVNNSGTTNALGQVSLWLADGNQMVTASKDGHYASLNFTVSGSAQSVVVSLSGQNGGGSGSAGGGFDSTNLGEIQQISLGGSHSGAVMKDGNLYMWGKNGDGQLGDGSKTDWYTPQKITDNNQAGWLREHSVEKLALGSSHSAAITKDGSLYMWGKNEYGQLGDGTTENRSRPVKVMENVLEVSLGSGHSAAITKDGSLYLWGRNNNGQLGDGTAENRSRPVKVMENVLEVSLGDAHSAAITKDGSLYLWGSGSSGKLGDGTTFFRYQPVKVMENILEVSLGDAHSAAVTKDGSLYLWGYNGYGELGDGTTTEWSRPIKLAHNIAKISLKGNRSAAITKDGSLYIWGENRYGELGDGTMTNRSRPVKVMENVSEVSLGNHYSAAITKDGSLYLWGSNGCGQLGDGTTTSRSLPTRLVIQDDTPSLHSLAEDAESPAVYHSISSYALSEDLEASDTDLGASDTDAGTDPDTDSGASDADPGSAHVDSGSSDTAPGSWDTDSGISPKASASSKSVTYTDLKPNADYLFYSMKYKGAVHPLSAANLLYIRQVQTDENGSFTLSYTPDEEYATPTDFVVAMAQTSIGEADVTMPSLSYSGAEQYVNPLLIYNEQRLAEGTDYRISGDYRADGVGEYRFMITGIGAFRGSRTVTYRVEKKDCKVLDVDPVAPLTYEGSAATPALVVKNGEAVLEPGKDYTVRYQNNQGAGIGIAEITGKGNYEGRQVVLFDILPCALEQAMLTPIPEQEYTGSALTPELVLKHGETVLTAGVDYQAEYTDNTEVGIAKVAITGIGSYTGNLQAQFTIIPKKTGGDDKDPDDGKNPEDTKKDCRSLDVAGIEPRIYTGSALTPEPVVKDQGTVLVKDRDYTVSYRSNTNAGTGILLISGKGSYEGTQVVLFDILPCALADAMLTPIPEQEYTGKALTPELTIKHGETVLVPGVDYRVSYADNTEVGTAKVTVTGTGSYTGNLTVQFTIVPKKSGGDDKDPDDGKNPGGDKDPDDGKEPGDTKKDCRNLDIADITPLTYNGSAQTPEFTVKDQETILVKDRDYTVDYRNNTDAGTGIAVISGKGGYEGRQIVLFDILPGTLNASMLSPIPEQKYTGKALTPQPVLKDGAFLLMPGIDYRVSYANNIKAGTASVTVTGTGNYTGTITAKFKIKGSVQKPPAKPGKAKISSLKLSGKKKLAVKWKKVKGASGYELQCSPKKNFKSGMKKLTIKKGGATKAEFKKLAAKKRYYVRIRAYKTVKKNGKNTKLAGAWSKPVRSKKIK